MTEQPEQPRTAAGRETLAAYGSEVATFYGDDTPLRLAILAIEAQAAAPEQDEAVRARIIETLHRWECDEEPPGHSYREHLPEDEPVVHPNRIDALVDLFAALATPPPVPAAPGLDPAGAER